MESLSIRTKSIIRFLLETKEQYVTSNDLAVFCHVSVRTIKNDIKYINEILKHNGAEVSAELFTGYTLIVSDRYLFNQFLSDNSVLAGTSAVMKPVYPYERINYIIKKLLAIDYYVSIENLMDELYVSRSTITYDLKEVRNFFSEFNLEIRTKPNYGIILEGDEINKRLCISEYYFHNNVDTGFLASDNAMFVSSANKKEIASVGEILSSVIENNNISMTDASFQDMLIHIIISIRRYKFYNYVRIESEKARQISQYNEFKAGEELKEKIETWQNIILPESESYYFALHFHSKHINDSNEISEKETVRVEELLRSFTDYLEKKYHFKYSSNPTFEQFFKLHIPLMVQRINTGMVIRNKETQSIFLNYPFATHIAYEMCRFIEREYNIRLNSNEFAYLVLYSNLLLTQSEKQKFRFLLVCSSGRLGSVTIVNEIADALNNYIQSIDMCDYSKVGSADLDQYDLVLFTMEIPQIETDVPLVYLDDSKPYIETVKKAIDLYFLYNIRIEDFIKEKYFINRMSASDRSEVLKQISRIFSNSDAVYRSLILQQTIIAETEKNIVFLNSELLIDDDFILFAVLRKPIIWKKQWVQMIIWVNVRNNDIKRIQSCYYYIGKLLKMENIIQKISTMKNYRELIHLIG